MELEKHHYRLKSYYEPLIREHGLSYRGMGWATSHLQTIRFEKMSAIADISKTSILDVGCGAGGFYHWLLKRGFTGNYTGIDFQKKMIQLAKSKYPAIEYPKINFECGDFLEVSGDHRAQYVFASGIFSLADMSLLRRTVTALFNSAEQGVAFNCLSSRAPRKSPKIFMFADPLEVEDFCKTLTKNVEMIHDYLPQDFTIYLYH